MKKFNEWLQEKIMNEGGFIKKVGVNKLLISTDGTNDKPYVLTGGSKGLPELPKYDFKYWSPKDWTDWAGEGSTIELDSWK